MDKNDLLVWCVKESEDNGLIDFPDDIFNSIDEETADFLARNLAATNFIRLPGKERAFFEWLKESDSPVWNDLWGNPEEEPYVVGVSFLPLLVKNTGRGYPICDLLEAENYYFDPAHIVDKEAKFYIESVQKRFMDKKELTNAQMLALEISIDAIDIWHFAYKHKISVPEAKEAVQTLVDDSILVHLTEAEHLAGFIAF